MASITVANGAAHLASTRHGPELVWDRCSRSRIESLSLLRVIAFVTVLLDHFGVAGPLAGVGLPVFMLLTGFLTTSVLLRERATRGTISVGGFWLRRARRILPGLLGYLAASTTLLVMSGIHVDWLHLGSAVLQSSNYYEAVRGPQESYLSHTWSLGLQEQFIIVWPFAILLFGRDARRLTILTVASIAAVWCTRLGMVGAGVNQSYIYRAFETRVDQILFGCLLALAVHRRVWATAFGVLARHPRAVLAVALSLLSVSAVLQDAIGPAYRDTIGFAVDPFFFVPVIVVVATFADRPAPTRILARAVGWLGDVSYGLYLYHPLAISTVLHFSPARGPAQIAAAFVLSTIAAASSWALIERPFRDGKARARRQPRVAVTAPLGWALTPVPPSGRPSYA